MEENHLMLHARLKAPEVPDTMSLRSPSVSRSKSDDWKICPSSIAPVSISPISIGLTPSLASIIPKSADISSPLEKVVSLWIATLPLSILAGMPTALNSPTIGPGPNSVGPAGIVTSSGKDSPAFAALPRRVFSSSAKTSKAFIELLWTTQGM